jgi:tetratricopeptide (TPR) repeat protein
MIGDHEKSIQYYERAMQLSPRDAFEFESYAGIAAHTFPRHYDQALHWADRSLRIKRATFSAAEDSCIGDERPTPTNCATLLSN